MRMSQEMQEPQAEAAWIQRVMNDVQGFACAWALIGTPLDTGTATDDAEQLRISLHALMCESPAAALLQRMLSPSDLGHAVSAEVRDLVRQVLGMPAVELIEDEQLRTQVRLRRVPVIPTDAMNWIHTDASGAKGS